MTEQIRVELLPTFVMPVASECGTAKATLLDRKTSGRVLVPINEQRRRETAEVGRAIADRILTSHLQPDEPLRYEPPQLPPEKAKPVTPGYSRTRSFVVRKPYRTWGRR